MSNAAVENKTSVLQRLLDGIERVGNKVPHPAIIFLGLIVLVIVLSAVLAAVGVSVTYDEVVESTPPVVQEEGLGGTPGTGLRRDAGLRRRRRDRPEDHGGREPPQRRRDPIPLLLVRLELRRLQRRRRHLRGDDGRGRGRGVGLDGRPHPQARQGGAGRCPHLHHRVHRHAVERRHRRGLPDPHPARRGCLPVRGPTSARRPGRRVRRCECGIRGQHPHHPERRSADRGHQRGHRAREPRPQHRHHREPVLQHPLDPVRHRRDHLPGVARHRAPARCLRARTGRRPGRGRWRSRVR